MKLRYLSLLHQITQEVNKSSKAEFAIPATPSTSKTQPLMASTPLSLPSKDTRKPERITNEGKFDFMHRLL
jgi:hypothetical protein